MNDVVKSEKNGLMKKENNLVSMVIECCKKPLVWRVQKVDRQDVYFPAYVPEVSDCPDCKSYFERKPGNSIAYKSTDRKSYSCTVCGSEVMGGTVAHPIHDGPFHLSGSGKCHYETVPYCPKCEKQPSSSGSFITVGKKF
ncbi:MAG: hypothetical protein V1645_01150 [archaeon]